MTRHLLWVLLILTLGIWPAHAQLDAVRLHLDQGALGLDGFIRPGAWTPLRLSIDNLSADDRDVLLRWELRDEDGDQLVAQRRVTLTRQRDKQPAWLYAPAAMTTTQDTRWNLRAIDAGSGELLASLAVQPDGQRLLHGGETLIAVTTNADLGLNDYRHHLTAHAPVRLVRGLSLDRVPDRWHGLESLHTFIWTQDRGGDPADPRQVGDAALAAMREWVYRGGHLVVVLPAVGQTWTGSPLADLLPVTAGQMRRVETAAWAEPQWMGAPKPEDPETLNVTTFEVGGSGPSAAEPASGPASVAVLLRDSEGRPIAVARRFGFGRVTLLGLDLTQPAIRAVNMPSGVNRLWNRLFNWQAPVLSEQYVEGQVQSRLMTPAHRLNSVALGDFIPGRIAMTGTVGTLLLGAVVIFGLYWLTGGWLLQPMLKRRGLERLTWVAFVGVVLVFAGVTWGGAALLRPSRTSLTHVTVLDLDGNGGAARGRSYVSMFVPRFGEAELATPSPVIAALGTAGHNLLSSPGFSAMSADTGFIDTRRYTIDAAAPDTAGVPVRSTSKQMVVDYLGPVDRDMPGLAEPAAILATRPVTADDAGWPVGELMHTLPGELTNVRLIFCRGEAFDRFGQRRPLEPVVWDHVNAQGNNRWAPSTPLILTGRAARHEPLFPAWRSYERIPADRDWAAEGFLGRRLGEQRGGAEGMAVAADESVIARHFELLTFFDAMPPPDFKRDPAEYSYRDGAVMSRRLGLRFDLTHLTQGRRLIVMGHLKGGPLPIPLTIDGQTPPSRGWTVVRWVYDF